MLPLNALTQPPGTIYQYCNLNYTILGLIVQTVAGEAYEHYMQEHVLAPLRMTNSFMSPDTARELARRGAKVIAVPSADWPAIAAKHYTFAVFRALETGAVLAKSEYNRV